MNISELEKFELSQAAKVWAQLRDDDRALLLRLPISKKLIAGQPAYKYESIPEMANLIKWRLADDGNVPFYLMPDASCPTSDPHRIAGYMEGYVPTVFGEVVARYGKAVEIVELVKSR